jgi:hypothetical protein
MASRKWDAYLTLNLTSRHSPGMMCAGSNRYDKGCRWDIPPQKYARVRGILDAMETTSPKDAVRYLAELVQLSLFQDYHQSQSYSLMEGWIAVIDDATRVYESGELLKTHILFLEQLREKSAAQEAWNGQQNANHLRFAQRYEEWNTALQSSEDKATTLRGLLVESTVEVTRLGALRNQERTSFSQQIFTERDRLAQYKKEVEEYCANQDKVIGDLRSKLEEEYQQSEGLSESLQKQETHSSNLLADIKRLEAGIAKERAKLDRQT